MTGKQYPNSGIMFKNDRSTHEKAPGYTGTGEVTCMHCGTGIDLKLALWARPARNGGKFLSLKFTPKGTHQTAATNNGGDFDDLAVHGDDKVF